jgi:hypothetical protein
MMAWECECCGNVNPEEADHCEQCGNPRNIGECYDQIADEQDEE